MKGKDCKSDDGLPYCKMHVEFMEAVQDLKTSVRWIAVIGGGLFTLGIGLATMSYEQWQVFDQVHADVSVTAAVLKMHIEDEADHVAH